MISNLKMFYLVVWRVRSIWKIEKGENLLFQGDELNHLLALENLCKLCIAHAITDYTENLPLSPRPALKYIGPHLDTVKSFIFP